MGATAETFVIKRIYDAPAGDDGCRVLVDRLWPRGVSKENAQLDLWLKDIAPSPPLRKDFGHMRERFENFAQNYRHELDDNPAVDTLLELAAAHSRVTLLYGARDPEVNHARVLLEFMREHA
ncbi:MAG TPA: DUF488 family protein [Arthrobacter sp.]|jgi:uncharacterized protein YeaO (DUF488 family)